jgi:hypothetical protein
VEERVKTKAAASSMPPPLLFLGCFLTYLFSVPLHPGKGESKILRSKNPKTCPFEGTACDVEAPNAKQTLSN